jgi:phosphoserine phosphatase
MMLKAPGWSPAAREGLERLIAVGAGRSLPAVFDFDNTIVCGDIGEATMALLAAEGVLTPGSIPESIAPPFLSRSGKMIDLRECPDVTVYYEELLDLSWHRAEDRAPLSAGYLWAVEIMQGLTALEVTAAADRVMAMGGPGGAVIGVTPGVSSYPVPFFYPQMVELLAVLLDNGCDPWVVSASNVWSVRRMVLRGLNPLLASMGCRRVIAPDRVVGVSMLMADREGRLCRDHLLAGHNGGYAAMDDETLADFTLTGLLHLPAPVYSGKVAAITDMVGQRPCLAVGDSPGDLPMLAHAGLRLWIARLEKTGYQREFAGSASATGGDWLVQPVICGKSPGFVAGRDEIARACGGVVPGPVAESLEVLGDRVPR